MTPPIPSTEQTPLLDGAVMIPMPNQQLRIPSLKYATVLNLHLYRRRLDKYGDAPRRVVVIEHLERVRRHVLLGLHEIEQHLLEVRGILVQKRSWKMFIWPAVAIPLLLFIDTYALFQSEEGLLPGAIILFTGVCLTAVWATSRILCLEHMIMKTVEARIRILEIAARVQGREAVKTRDEEWFERKAWGGVFWDFGGV